MKTEHLGRTLAKEIKEKGYSKKNICIALSMCYNTLMSRLRKGNFTHHEVVILTNNRYLSN